MKLNNIEITPLWCTATQKKTQQHVIVRTQSEKELTDTEIEQLEKAIINVLATPIGKDKPLCHEGEGKCSNNRDGSICADCEY